MRKITIIGVGLIGGSLGLAWKKYVPGVRVTGCDAPDVLDTALRLGAVDVIDPDPALAVEDADLVVVAVPIGTIPDVLRAIAPHLRPGCVVTDVGSVKSPVAMQAAGILSREVSFVGGHPMAGAERGGVENANALLFENATYVLCPPDGMDDASFSAHFGPLISLLDVTGARILTLSPDRHDRIAAAVSHLPQILAVSLMNVAAGLNQTDDAFLRLAAGGFRDMTRIASSPFDIWRDIVPANRDRILEAIDRFSVTLAEMRALIDTGRPDRLEQAFLDARHMRDTIPKNTKGFLHPLSDINVLVEDRPGILLTICRILYDHGINISDVELLKIREGAGGAFRMSFADDETAGRALDALHTGDFTAFRV